MNGADGLLRCRQDLSGIGQLFGAFCDLDSAKIQMHRGADAFGALDRSKTAVPARQFPGSGSPRSDCLQRIEDILQALGRETETIGLDREPKIIARTATWKIDN